MERRCFHKKLEFQTYPPNDLCTARYEHKSSKKSFKLFKNPENNNSWADLGPRSAWEQLSQMFVRSGEIPSRGQTSIDKTNDCAMNLHGARSLGAPTHPLVTVFTKRTVIRGGRRPGVWYKHIWVLPCRKQAIKIIDPSPMAKNRPFFRLGRRACNATGNLSPPRPQIHLTSSRPSSTLTGLARHEAGWPWVDSMSRSKAYRHVSCFWSGFRQFSTWTRKFRRVQQREQKKTTTTTFFPVFPIAAVRAYLQPVSFLNSLER